VAFYFFIRLYLLLSVFLHADGAARLDTTSITEELFSQKVTLVSSAVLFPSE
jgi:hypothetical protein